MDIPKILTTNINVNKNHKLFMYVDESDYKVIKDFCINHKFKISQLLRYAVFDKIKEVQKWENGEY